MNEYCSLAHFENVILSYGSQYVVFRVQRKYRRCLQNWAEKRFGVTFPPKFKILESLIDSSYSDFQFNQGTIQQQWNTYPIDYLNVKFYWRELIKYLL